MPGILGSVLDWLNSGATERTRRAGSLLGSPYPPDQMAGWNMVASPEAVMNSQAANMGMALAPMGILGINPIENVPASQSLLDKLRNKYDWFDEFLGAGGKVERDGTIWLYHRTTPDAAAEIAKSGVIKSPSGTGPNYGVYGSSSDPSGTYGGDGLIAFRVHPSSMRIDDVMRDRADFRIPSTNFRPLEIKNLTGK